MPGAGIVLSASSTSRCEFLTYLTTYSLPYCSHRSPLLTERVTVPEEVSVLRRGTSGPCSAWRSSHWSSSRRRLTARADSTRWHTSWSHRLAAWHRTSLPRHRAARTWLSRRVHGSRLIVRTRARLGLANRLLLSTSRSGLSRTRLSTTKIKIQS